MWLFVRVAWQFTTSFTVLFASSLKFSLLINYNSFHKKTFYFTQDDRRPKGGNLCTKLFFECPEFSPLFLSTLKKLFHLNVIFFNYIFALEIQQFVSFFMIAWYLYSGWNFTQFLYIIIYFYTAWQELWLKCILVATYYVAILPTKCFFYKDNNIDFF